MYYVLKKNTFFCLCILLFTGCSQYPDKQSALSGLSLQEATKNALTSSIFTEGDWPSKEWWEIFDDPQLSHLITEAIKQNPTIQVAQAKFIEAQQNARMIKASLFPKVDAHYLERWQYFSKNGFIRNFFQLPTGSPPIPSKVNYLNLGLDFIYEFDFFGKNKKKLSAALGQARAELAERIQTELTISALVAFSYFEYQKHKNEEELQEKICQYFNDLYSIYERKATYGVSNFIPVLDAEKEYLDAQKKLLEAKKNSQIDHYVLCSLLGQSPDSDLNLMVLDLTFEKAIPLPSNIGADLLARRADLVAMIWKAESASKEVAAAKTEYYPNINLMAFGSLESLQFPTLFSWSSRQGALQPALHLPIFTAGKISANISSKMAKFNQAIESYNEALLNAVKEVASELTSLKTIDQQLELQNNIVNAKVEKETLFNSRYVKGLDSQISWLNAKQENIQAKLYRIELQNYKMLSIIRLIKAIGGGYEADDLPPIINKG